MGGSRLETASDFQVVVRLDSPLTRTETISRMTWHMQTFPVELTAELVGIWSSS